MTTSKAVLALCLVGVAVAAPQLRLGGLRSVSSVSSVTNQDEVVTNVVSALTPSIAAAVEQALAAQAAAEAARVEAERRAAEAEAARLEAERRAAAEAAAAAAAAAASSSNSQVKYNFEYKVAEDEDQVYITQNEARDGDELQGTYSFVDPRGALVTVNYEAGPMGYSEIREEKLGFVEIRSKPARVAPAPPKVDQGTLIQRILAILQPQIGSAVSSALQARREAAAAAEAEAAAAAAAEAARIEAERIAAANAAAAAAAAEKNSFDSQVSADLGPYVDPVYNFEYKVADDEERTYISRNEERDGNELSGSYSFIDATGALVTVDYTAGVNGYAETRTKEAGKVTMKAVPAWDGPLAGVEEASGAVAVAKGSTSSSSRFGSSVGSRTSSTTSSSSSRSQSDLIAQILAALTPQINSAVAAALA